MKLRFSLIEINVFHFFQLVGLDSGFAGILLIDLGRFNSHLLKIKGLPEMSLYNIIEDFVLFYIIFNIMMHILAIFYFY